MNVAMWKKNRYFQYALESTYRNYWEADSAQPEEEFLAIGVF